MVESQLLRNPIPKLSYYTVYSMGHGGIYRKAFSWPTIKFMPSRRLESQKITRYIRQAELFLFG